MFETPEEAKQTEPKGFWIGIAVVIVVAAAGGYLFLRSRGNVAKPTPAAASASATAKGDADPVHDLKVQRATMSKDRTGTMAVWFVTLENKSTVYSYSNIKYETTYVGVDNNAVLVNQGTLAATLAPGEQKNSQINDALYPAGTVWYKLRITGASSQAQ